MEDCLFCKRRGTEICNKCLDYHYFEPKHPELYEPNMVVYAVPNKAPIIISADKAEEFLNMKPNEESIKKREEILEKYKHIVTDNTKK